MSERVESEKLKELRANRENIVSISRLNNFNQCKHGFYLTYISEVKKKNGIYGLAGGLAHEIVEDILHGKLRKEEAEDKFREGMKDILTLAKFPDASTEKKYIESVAHYFKNYKGRDKKCLVEEEILYHITHDYYILGYVDYIEGNEDGSLTVIDHKTSSKFKGKEKLKEAGRQLILYAIVLEDKFKRPVSKVAWSMMKFCVVRFNGEKRTKTVERCNMLEPYEDRMKKALLQMDYSPAEANEIVVNAIINNEIPEELVDLFEIEDCLVEYEITEERKAETIKYIEDTIVDMSTEVSYSTLEDVGGFFCHNLCSVKEECVYYMAKCPKRLGVESGKVDLDDIF